MHDSAHVLEPQFGPPEAHGLYDPRFEHDACGVGFAVDIKGRKSKQVVDDAIRILLNLEHRGACGCEDNTGDGAGILIQVPDKFLRRVLRIQSLDLPALGDYGVGIVFLPKNPDERATCMQAVERHAAAKGFPVLAWRDVPRDNSMLGATALEGEPVMKMVFIPRGEKVPAGMDFERRLYVIRKLAEHEIRGSGLKQRKLFYIPSLSSRTLVYKGMLTSGQLPKYFTDLSALDLESALAVVHSRFSTNTFPSWPLAHPFRYLAHNGEINTLRGNINWMHCREALMQSELFESGELAQLLPIVLEGGSDSATLDNVLELLFIGGRSLAHSMMMLIPEAWSNDPTITPEKRAFYEFHACVMEAWDGPAAVAFTDGIVVGATLDRNGLRPGRYYVTKDGKVICASEVGVLDVPAERILQKGRLQPGRMFLVDTAEGRIISDDELKQRIATGQPYRRWLDEGMLTLEALPEPAAAAPTGPDAPELFQLQQAFGYTVEDLKVILTPMATNGEEPIGSMGDDTPLAVLSDRPQLLYNYFKQCFAQVTNPPLDAIREEIVTDVNTALGPEASLLTAGPDSCRQIKIKAPILTNEEMARIKHLDHKGFKSRILPMLFAAEGGGAALAKAVEGLCAQADQAIAEGYSFLVLSDRGVNKQISAVPALLAVSAVHHHLVRGGNRTRVSLVVESGEPREVHHFALLIGYGAAAINPYLAFDSLNELVKSGQLAGVDHQKAVYQTIKALVKGVVKVMSKMGISTIQSYRGAQIFEAIGLRRDFVDTYFTHTPSRIGGAGLDEVAQEQFARHQRAWPASANLDVGGRYKFRRDGEFHLFNPDVVHKLQASVRNGDYNLFKAYTALVNDQSKRQCTLRGLFEFKSSRKAVPLDEVEPVEAIVMRFATGAMSYGSISKEAHENLAIAMNRLGGMSNTGEGGEDPARYDAMPNGDSKNSAIKQVASGRFGVTSRYLTMARELQIKMAQGAKPGEGGQLPAHKVYPWIAKTRHSTPFVGLISPPPHHDIYSIEDLAQLIFDLKNANTSSRISVKLVAEVGVGTVAAGVAKAHADVVLISGHDGGTGAAPLTSIKHAGIPWELGLAETQQVLVLNDLRGRIIVQVDGQLKTGRDVVVAALLGAEEYGFATAALVASGCIMARICHLNTCPVGVATQDPELRKKFAGKPEHVVNFMRFIAQETRELMAGLGFRSIDEMVGHSEVLDTNDAILHWKSRGLDFSRIFDPAKPKHAHVAVRHTIAQDHGLASALDHRLIESAREALEHKKPVRLEVFIRNTDRATGTMLGSEVTRRHPAGLLDDTIHLKFIGSAGQSFGAFVPKGVTLELEGDSNDHVGKGLSGGRLIVYPPAQCTFAAEENIIVGNVLGYGATAGEIYVRGAAGERCCVRNSGAQVVVEGTGDHGCEYMTGGCVVVLGKTGRNFAAGMSGGVAYVLDEDGTFAKNCNPAMVGLEKLESDEDLQVLKNLIQKHHYYTESRLAQRVLEHWAGVLPKFVKVMPHDYKKALERIKAGEFSLAVAD